MSLLEQTFARFEYPTLLNTERYNLVEHAVDKGGASTVGLLGNVAYGGYVGCKWTWG